MLTAVHCGNREITMQKIEKMARPTMIKRAGRAGFLAGIILTLLPCVPAAAQQGRGGRAPDQSLSLVQQAFKMTDARYLISFSRYCMVDGPNTANGKGDAATPSQLFDNLYYLGKTDVGAWALKTSDGLVLFDTLNNPDEAANIVVPGLRKLGLNPDQIKLVVLTHSHNDHTGGLSYFRAKGLRVMASEADWGPLGGVPNPESVIHDGQVVNVGETPITFLLIPGHTPGTIAAMFPVYSLPLTSHAERVKK